jgi:hypothetical protein
MREENELREEEGVEGKKEKSGGKGRRREKGKGKEKREGKLKDSAEEGRGVLYPCVKSCAPLACCVSRGWCETQWLSAQHATRKVPTPILFTLF